MDPFNLLDVAAGPIVVFAAFFIFLVIFIVALIVVFAVKSIRKIKQREAMIEEEENERDL